MLLQLQKVVFFFTSLTSMVMMHLFSKRPKVHVNCACIVVNDSVFYYKLNVTSRPNALLTACLVTKS